MTAQSSPEGIINVSGPQQPFAADQRAHARRRFYAIINHFHTADNSRSGGYRHPKLVLYTYEYSRSELSQDTFLRAFLKYMNLDVAGEEEIDFDDEDLEKQLGQNLIAFADFLLHNFFLPRLLLIQRPIYIWIRSTSRFTVKASGRQTLQPSPASLSAIQSAQGGTREFYWDTRPIVSPSRFLPHPRPSPLCDLA
ncbi:hypothetical protein GX51_05977 [Blastomyces parvus]|uniref:Uncharacterized protein n=1 Tax=Blastomyces parvus TaxID=2060905 RepID=A0A2B7WU09_9EURO|nr:hypothetical protein GX51_05977 [Blastomyces parvus]